MGVYFDDIDNFDKDMLLEKALDSLSGGVGIFELRGSKPVIKFMSTSFFKMFDVTEEQMQEYKGDYIMLAIPEDRHTLKKQILETITTNKTTVRELRFTNVNTGGYIWIQLFLSVMSIKKGIIELCAVFIDVSTRMSDQLDQRAQEQMLKLILQESGESLFVYDVENDLLANKKMIDGEMLTTRCYEAFYANIDSQKMVYSEDCSTLKEAFSDLIGSGRSSDESEKVTLDLRLDLEGNGRYEWYRILFVPLKDSHNQVRKIFGKYYSINDEKLHNQELILRAERDSLTGIYNHVTFQRKVTDMLEMFMGEMCAFYVMDIDNFKHINDAFGHYAGDDLLCDVAVNLEEAVASSGGFSGRLGGDEFALFIPAIDDRDMACELADTIQKCISDINCGLPHTVSIGISIHRIDEGVDFDTMYRQADQALYASKRSGKNRYLEYSDELETATSKGTYSNYSYNDDEGLVLDEITDIVYVSDVSTYELYYMNKAAKRSLNMAENDDSYKNRKCYEFLQEKKSPCEFCTNNRLTNGTSCVSSHYNQRVGRQYVLMDKLVDWHGKRSRMEIALDISDTDKVTHILADSFSMADALSSSLKYITSDMNYNEKYIHILEALGSFYNSKNACLVEYHEETGKLYYWKSPNEDSIKENLSILEKNNVKEEMSEEVNDDQVLIVNRSNPLLHQDTEFANMLAACRIWSVYAVPIIADGKLFGRIFVFNPERHNGDLRIMKSFSTFIGNNIYQRRLKEKEQYEYTHDSMTKCYNRNSYIDYIRNRKTLKSLGILIVDINETRGIAEMFGPDYAENVIFGIVGKMRNIFPHDKIYRMGYDNFIIVCEDMEQLKFNVYAQRLRESLQNGEFTACIGYVWNDCSIDVKKMEDHATKLLFSEKQQWYEQNKCQSVKWSTIKTEMVKKELQEGLFYVLYQPKMSYPEGTICGAEALVRYSGNDDLADVIDRLEKSNTIRFVDLFVLDSVCRDIARWKERGVSCVPVSCNFSRVSLMENDVAEQIAAVVDKYGIPHHMVEIEITESVSEQEHERLKDVAKRIHELGFKIAMDDFGTKYSNVSILASLGFDIVKFDKSMINDVDSNPVTVTVMSNLIRMCRELNMICIAEGVENTSQADVLLRLGLTKIQGYLCSKPLEEEYYLEMCAERGTSDSNI